TARSSRRTECSAQSRLLDSSAAAIEVRTPYLLRSRSERNLLLDDETGDRAVVPPRILDDWPQCLRRRLPIAKACGGGRAGCISPRPGDKPAAAEAALEDVLPAGGHKIVPATTAPSHTEVYDCWSMVLGWRR